MVENAPPRRRAEGTTAGLVFRLSEPGTIRGLGLPTIDDMAEEFGGLFGIVDGGVRGSGVPGNVRGDDATCQHRLSKGHTRQGYGVEGAERMKGIAFVSGTFDRCIDKAEIEKGVVSDQDGAFAGAGLYRSADRAKDLIECLAFRQCVAKRVTGIDTVEFERLGIEIGAFERHDMAADGLGRFEIARVVHAQDYRGDFQQRIRLGVESRGLHIDHDR